LRVLAANEHEEYEMSLADNQGMSTFMASGSDGSTALTNTAQAVSSTPARIFGYWITNPNAAVEYIQFYNQLAANVTVGTTIPFMTISIPASSSANLSLPYGIQCASALSVAATDSAGGNGAPGTGLDLVLWYVNGLA